MDIFVPGRLCLFGEHSDWASLYKSQNKKIKNGKALVLGLNLGIYAKVFTNDKIVINSTVEKQGKIIQYTFESELNDKKINEAIISNDFFSYIASVCKYMIIEYKTGGIFIDNYKTTLPIKKGLSSSASISILVVRAFNKLYNLNLDTDSEIDIAYKCEQNAKSKCGKMDHTCALGQKLFLTTFTEDKDIIEIVKNNKEIYIVIVDLNGQKETRTILENLNNAYPFPSNSKEKKLHRFLGQYNIHTIKKAIKIVKKGNSKKLGKLMTSYQKKFDKVVFPLSPTQLKSPILHYILRSNIINTYIYGGKGVGSHGDGCAQLVAKDKLCQEALIKYLKKLALKVML